MSKNNGHYKSNDINKKLLSEERAKRKESLIAITKEVVGEFPEYIFLDEEFYRTIGDYKSVSPVSKLFYLVEDKLKEHLEPGELRTLQRLYSNSNGTSSVFRLNGVGDKVRNIAERLVDLTKKYCLNLTNGGLEGEITLNLIFDPFRMDIRFGERDYNGNALEVYEEDLELYGGLHPIKLKEFDPPMFEALKEKGLIEGDSLRLNSGLLKVKLPYIEFGRLAVHKVYKMMICRKKGLEITETSRRLGINTRTVRKYFKAANEQGL